jgi:hypothetical protein
VAGFCKHGNEPSNSIVLGNLLTGCTALRKDSTPVLQRS